MEESLKQIGERLKGLRDVLDIPAEEVAQICEISLEDYLKTESGEAELSVSRLVKISKHYGISLDVLMFGEEPKMSNYFLTRKDQGLTVERRKAYKYQSLAGGFRGRKADPFMTTVMPLPEGERHGVNSHDGQEFNYIVEGRMELTIGNKVLTLEPGDSIYFDSTQPHCMHALDNQPVKFLAIIV